MKYNATMRSSRYKLFTIISALLLCLVSVKAQANDVPSIVRYYPEKGEVPANVTSTTKVYLYFTAGSRIVSNEARIIQDGNVIGTVHFATTSKTNAYTYTTVMDQSLEVNSDMQLLSSGEFTLEIYEVTYISDGEPTTYTSDETPLGSVTYIKPVNDGVLVSETGLDDKVILSYWKADADGGVKTYTFDKPLIKDGVNAYFEYGSGNYYNIVNVPCSVSDDALTVTVDLRGACYNPNVLAPGHTFLDDDGNPTDPPSTIALIVSGLYCTDGSQISYEAYSADGAFHTTVRGKVHQVYTYKNITFPTPALTEITFFASDKPSIKYPVINDGTDMLALTLEGAQYITSADIILSVGAESAEIPYNSIIVSGQTFKAALPEKIRQLGSSHLVVSLCNVTYNIEDGETHVIRPLLVGDPIAEINAISELAYIEPNTRVILNLTDGLKITMSNEFGDLYGEDSTGGILILTEDYTQTLQQSTLLKGKIDGTYLGSSVFLIDIASSDYITMPVNTATGTIIEDMTDLAAGTYNYCLVTVFNSENTPIMVDEDHNVLIGSRIMVISRQMGWVTTTNDIESVTGILIIDHNTECTYLMLRDENDLTTGIASIGMDPDLDEDIYDIRGVKVHEAHSNDTRPAPGLYITRSRKFIIRK